MKKLYWNFITTACLTIALVTGSNSSAQASDIESKNTTYRMDVYHLTGEVHFQGNVTGVTPDRPAEFMLTRGTAVEVWIMDNNPFLFTYQDKIETKETEDYAAFSSIEDTLSKVWGQIRNKALDKEERTPEEICKNPESTDELLCILRDIEEKITLINNHLTDRKSIIAQTTRSAESVDTAQDTVEGWNLSTLDSELRKDYAELEALIKQNPEDSVFNQLSLVLHQKDGLLNALAALHEFERILNKVHKGQKLENLVETKDSRLRYEMTISVKRNKDYRNLFTQESWEAQEAGVGKFQLHFERKSYVRYVISPGVVYSFVEDPEFKVEEDTQGNRTIAKTSDDYKEFSGAVMLNIIPEDLFETNFEPFLQLGASADGDSIGLLLGAGFSVFAFPNDKNEVQRTLTVSGGVIWQEVDKLKDGLHVGDSLTTHSELQLDQEMDAGFYLMLGATF